MKKIVCLLLVCMMLVPTFALAAESWKCDNCGRTNTGNFCPNDATPRPDAAWTCPKCSAQNTGAFCENCGTAKPAGSAPAAASPSSNTTASRLPKEGVFSADGKTYLGPEPEQVSLSYNKGKPVTAYAVRLSDCMNDIKKYIEVSPDKISFGSTLGNYWMFQNTVEDCLGIAVDIEIVEKTPDELRFKVGMLNKRKGDYCDYHNEVLIDECETGTVKCYNRQPKKFDGFKIMGAQANGYSFIHDLKDVTLYFADRDAAVTFVRSLNG
ncbi:MAG: hypothetical protein Q4C53_05645 [Clostridia bacterium]|nr:hypothetical protein [Clostridia bacterium]